ncbi:MAG: 4-hydroxy-tetrahydrodipicolinate reductase [Acetobacterales bacterium]
MARVRSGIAGCGGRMGRLLTAEVAAADDCTLAAATGRPGSGAVGRDAGIAAGIAALGVTVSDDPATLFADSDAVIDFTRPEATLKHAALAAERGTPLVIGTTGFDADGEAALAEAARHAPVVLAPNTAAGVNLLFALTERVARALDDAFDVEIVEIHHRYKVDAPSGTALELGRRAARGRGVALDEVADRGRDGETGARLRGRIGFAALRGGDVVGEHTVVFAGDGERIELTHRASARAIYARGAVRAVRWLRGRPPGLYNMFDVLGLSEG